MSKYYKAEDVQELINACEWRMTLAKERQGEGFVDYSKQVLDVDEFTKRLSDLPTIEVSEDAISREYLEEQYWQTLIPKEVINTDIELGINIGITKMHENIKNAPSVLPRRSCYRCGFREDCEDSTERKPKESEWIPCCERLPNNR